MTQTAFDTALAGLYAAFDAPRPRAIHGCPCCIDERNVDLLLSKPLRDLTADDLHGYVSGVFLTVGSEADHAYLLPRMLEISAVQHHWSLDPQMVVGRLRRAEWERWSAERRKAMVAFLDAWFDRALAQADADEGGLDRSGRLEDLLCGMAMAGLDIGPYLERLKVHGAVLTNLYWRFGDPAAEGRGPSGFWQDAPEGWSVLMAFMKDPEVFAVVARVSGIFPGAGEGG